MGTPERASDASAVEGLLHKALSLKPAPTPLRHVQLLLNTRNLLGGYDLLSDEATARRCLALIAARDGHSAPRDRDDAMLLSLIDVREAVRELLLSHAAGRTPDQKIRERIRAAGAAVRLSVDLDASGTPIVAPPEDARGADRIIADVMAA